MSSFEATCEAPLGAADSLAMLFPGATGAGDTFEATWSNFLGTAPQPQSQADSATQR